MLQRSHTLTLAKRGEWSHSAVWAHTVLLMEFSLIYAPKILYRDFAFLFLIMLILHIYCLLVYYNYYPPLRLFLKIIHLPYSGNWRPYSFATTTSPSRSSFRKLVKGGNFSIFLRIHFAVPSIASHRFAFEQGAQNPLWKGEASSMLPVGGPVGLPILNAYVCDSSLDSMVAVRAALR